MPPSKVTKRRSDSVKQHQQPIQFWDGKTYACNACKRGHRQMFLVVALKSRPKPVWINQEPEQTPQWTDENGEQKTLNPPQIAMSKDTKASFPRQAPSRCTCGAKCQCTLCPDHPNNTATRQYNAQQLNAMAANPNGTYIPTQSMVNGQLFKPEVPQGSCMGGEASYFLTREQPTLHDFHRLFPDYSPDDFVLTYPMDTSTHTYTHMNNMASAAVPPLPDIHMPIDPLATMPPLDDTAFDMTFMNNEPLDFSFGDANVTTFGKSDTTITSPDIAGSQTINPDLLQGAPPYAAQVQPAVYSVPSGPDNLDYDLFDTTLPPVSVEPDIDMTALLGPSFHISAQPVNHVVSHPVADP
ncbi:hypothetical protein DV737_g4818, partial [Chaetothyriales sp. CBS 132003]